MASLRVMPIETFLPFEHEPAGERLGDAEQRLAEFRAPSADQAVDAEDFTACEASKEISRNSVRMTVILDFENGAADLYRELRKHVLDVAADHELRTISSCGVSFSLPLSDGAAVAEDDEVVGDLVKFVELVAYEKDRLALFLQALERCGRDRRSPCAKGQPSAHP